MLDVIDFEGPQRRENKMVKKPWDKELLRGKSEAFVHLCGAALYRTEGPNLGVKTNGGRFEEEKLPSSQRRHFEEEK